MNWLNIPISIIRAPQYVGCEPVERATWLNVIVYCCEQENKGRIVGARTWRDRQWQQTCGVTLAEVSAACDLWSWDGDDLVVWGYPDEKEDEVRQKREAGRRGGMARTQAKAEAARANGSKRTSSTTQADEEAEPKHNPITNPTEEKGKERKRKEENGKEDSPPLPPETVEQPRPRPRAGGSPINPMVELKARINGLRPEWAKPAHWSSAEDHALFGGVSSQMAEMTEEDWKLLKAYLGALHRQGEGYWVPNNRSKFVDTFADVFSHATRWGNKNGHVTAPKAPDAEKGVWR